MKKVKIGFWVLVLAFLLLLGFQNKLFFLQKNAFGLNFYVGEPYMSPEIYNGVTFAVCFLAGLIIAYLFGLFESFRTRKTIKQLNMEIESQRKEMETLKTELNAFKGVSTPLVENPVAGDDENTEAEATKVLS
jgi:hypothetical protein